MSKYRRAERWWACEKRKLVRWHVWTVQYWAWAETNACQVALMCSVVMYYMCRHRTVSGTHMLESDKHVKITFVLGNGKHTKK